MDKVVLLTDRLEEPDPMMSFIKIVFIECEVQVQLKQAAKLRRMSLALEPSVFKK
jgi:hypothetical protein